MRIIIFGSGGMLGTYLQKYLDKDFEIIALTRNNIDLTSSEDKIIDFSINHLKINNSDIIINAAGIIKQRLYNLKEMIMVNSIFPHILEKISTITECQVIHITTDCVYDGAKGNYIETDLHNCTDDYGKSKSLGENPNLTVIRTSIIGEENSNKKSLIEWVKSQKNKEINGFSNHYWNGLTCLELTKFIKNVIINRSYWKGTRHIFSPEILSKYDLILLFNEIYKLNLMINLVNSEFCDRSLSSVYPMTITKSLQEQIQEQALFLIK